MKITKPMLAVSVEDLTKIEYPVYVSPKLDGIRCLKIGADAVTRKFKEVPNHFIREYIEKHVPHAMDGEIMVPGKTFNEAQGDIMREEGEPNFQYHIFDYIDDSINEPFEKRYNDAMNWCKDQKDKHFKIVPHYLVNNEQQLLKREKEFLKKGFEGLMVRKIDGPYKSGRSTLNEGYLLKFKRFVDSEAEITGFVELMINNNPKELNELGDNIRKKKKEFLVPGDTLGAFLVKDLYSGVEFEIGTGQGLTKELRKEIWEHQKKYKSKIVKYRFQEAGKKDKPRFPSWLGFRDPRDMS